MRCIRPLLGGSCTLLVLMPVQGSNVVGSQPVGPKCISDIAKKLSSRTLQSVCREPEIDLPEPEIELPNHHK